MRVILGATGRAAYGIGVDEPPTRPDVSPSITLLTLSRGVERALEAALEPHGLTLRKYAVLGHIAGSPGISYSELARRSGITVQSTHTLIRSLLDAGLVASEVDAAGSPARLTPTAAGGRLLAAIRDDVAALDRGLFTEEPLASLRPALDAISRAMMSRD